MAVNEGSRSPNSSSPMAFRITHLKSGIFGVPLQGAVLMRG